jgi:hypothetical protein
MHWMSLPVTRSEWNAMMRDTLRKAETEVAAEREQANREDRS